jgi:hypothetical protein
MILTHKRAHAHTQKLVCKTYSMSLYVVDRGGATTFTVGDKSFRSLRSRKVFSFVPITFGIFGGHFISVLWLSLQNKTIYVHLYMLIYFT